MPPYIKLQSWPSPTDVVKLFKLSGEQSVPFLRMVYVLTHPDASQMLMILRGSAGTGKSLAAQALLWYAFQTEQTHAIAIASYTWRATLNSSTLGNRGSSTASFFGIDTYSSDRLNVTPRVQARNQHALADVRLVIIDEFTFISQRHLCSIEKSATMTRRTLLLGPQDAASLFAGLHVALVGDPYQHEPIASGSLFTGSWALMHHNSPPSHFNTRGWSVWTRFEEVYELHTNFRIQDPHDPLLRCVHSFMIHFSILIYHSLPCPKHPIKLALHFHYVMETR